MEKNIFSWKVLIEPIVDERNFTDKDFMLLLSFSNFFSEDLSKKTVWVALIKIDLLSKGEGGKFAQIWFRFMTIHPRSNHISSVNASKLCKFPIMLNCPYSLSEKNSFATEIHWIFCVELTSQWRYFFLANAPSLSTRWKVCCLVGHGENSSRDFIRNFLNLSLRHYREKSSWS